MEDLQTIKERYIKVAIEQAERMINALKNGNINSLDYAAWLAGDINYHIEKLVSELKKNEK